jgi:hypothetical protein
MPYFVFSVRPFGQIEKLAEFGAFKEASAHAKALRKVPEAKGDARVKVMFADNAQLAEDLLCQVREAGPTGDD